MKLQRLKYLIAFLPFAGVYQAIVAVYSWQTWTSVIYLLMLLPVLEVVLGEFKSESDEDQKKRRVNERWYDYLLYMMLPFQYGLLFYFLFHISFHELTTFEYMGNIASMGISCGTIGINVAHELGHRSTKFEQFLAKALLLTSSYLHFYIEHNRGHHKNVSTIEDPASARYGENLYSFWIRTIVFSYISAWKIENDRLRKKELPILGLKNEMLRFQLVQLMFMGIILLVFGWAGVVGYLGCSIVGILLLESVNYIQHYGLARKLKADQKTYEQVIPEHSWNSAFPVGQVVLFELGKHSDHHYRSNKKYQILEDKQDSPQMPTGYSGMILMALLPPLWFWVMNPLAAKYR